MQTSSSSIHMLLVENDEVDIESVKREFNKLDAPIDICIAKDGFEALDKLYGRNGQKKITPTPKIIMLDINMPKMNGIEFLKKLRADTEFRKTHVFIFTGAYNTHDKLAMQDLNVSSYIVKPLQYDDVLHIYWTIMDGTP